MAIHKISVQLAGKSYPIMIGSGMLAGVNDEMHLPHFRGKRGVIITNETVAALHLNQLLDLFARTEYDVAPIVISDGEQYKNQETLFSLYRSMYDAGLQRDGFVCAFGGGVIGDLAGFAAATYMRGIDLLQVPTTLLAQVDSAIGGKNGINLPVGKNLVGTFYQPRAVISDVDLLTTLPEEEFYSGLGEVVKYALIAGEDFVSFLEMNHQGILAKNPKILASMLHYCSRIKADFVARDELEQLGVRAILNLGHTMAHALEKAGAYRGIKHGAAVAIGLAYVAYLSVEAGFLAKEELRRITALLELFGLQGIAPDDVSADELLAVMERDKKVANGKLNMVLLRNIGQPFVQSNISREHLLAALEKCRQPLGHEGEQDRA
ncbi:MAG: 3-dehydroquinate synthase [Deltaproteobacteria bacterium]|nr:3-dehydroquinate synthase [Candidatus Anaeroferrophillus wilburensis]MBN2890009.1 3-dehydroquinate synthase [Deltaproteobacteria bacterium]